MKVKDRKEERYMCLGMPMKIVEKLDDAHAVAEALGARRTINIMATPDVKIGEYVMVHAGMAISKVEEKEAEEALEIWSELMNIWNT